MLKRLAPFPLALMALASAARADAPDVTASLEYLFAPAESRWGTSAD